MIKHLSAWVCLLLNQVLMEIKLDHTIHSNKFLGPPIDCVQIAWTIWTNRELLKHFWENWYIYLIFIGFRIYSLLFDDLAHFYFFSNLEIGKAVMVSIQHMHLWVIAIFRIYRKFNCFNNLGGNFLGWDLCFRCRSLSRLCP